MQHDNSTSEASREDLNKIPQAPPQCPKCGSTMIFVDGAAPYHSRTTPHWRCEAWIGSGVCGAIEDAKHSRLPWTFVFDHRRAGILSSENQILAELTERHNDIGMEEIKANAKFIAMAVNAHEDMLMALAQVKGLFNGMRGHWPGTMSISSRKIEEMVDDALAKAEGRAS